MKKIATFALPFALLLFLSVTIASSGNFQRHAILGLSGQEAVKVGILKADQTNAPFGIDHVWVSKTSENQYSYKSHWPIIGVSPFNADFFGNGDTSINIEAYCKRHDSQCVHLIKG